MRLFFEIVLVIGFGTGVAVVLLAGLGFYNYCVEKSFNEEQELTDYEYEQLLDEIDRRWMENKVDRQKARGNRWVS